MIRKILTTKVEYSQFIIYLIIFFITDVCKADKRENVRQSPAKERDEQKRKKKIA